MSELDQANLVDGEPMRGDVMDVAGVAEYLGLSTSTIYDKVQAREIPYVRIGNLLRFPRASVDRWLAESTVQPWPTFYQELARLAGRFFFRKWLESRGVDPGSANPDEVAQLAAAMVAEVQSNPSDFDYPANEP